MSPESKRVLAKVAARVYRDPSKATLDEIRKLAAGWCLEVDGKLPDGKR